MELGGTGPVGSSDSGLGGGLTDAAGGGGLVGQPAGAQGLPDLSSGQAGAPPGSGIGGFFDSIEKAVTGIDLTAALGGLFGATIGGLLGPAGSSVLGYAGAKGADALFGPASFDSLTGGPAPAAGAGTMAGLIDKGFGALSSATGGTPTGPTPTGTGSAGTDQASALLPASNAAIALGVPTGTTANNVAKALGT